MGSRNTKNGEAEAYNKAGDEAHKRGNINSAEMFYDMAAAEQAEADRVARNGRRDSRRG